MARIRTIKPEFVESESIGKLSREARLLFILLWTFVDDSGKSRASSRLLASRLFPYDDDAAKLIGSWLEELEQGGHIRLYEVEGDSYLDIPNWLKHQKIDHPATSRLPEFRETFAKPSEKFAKPSETIAPHTLDLGPVPRTKDLGPLSPGGDVACTTPEDVTKAFALFNDSALRTGWPAVQKIDDDRRKAMRGRLKDIGGVEGFAIALGKAEGSRFLTEQWPNFNLDWMLKPKNFRKLMEGNYDDRNSHDPNERSLTAGLAGLAEAGAVRQAG